MKQTSHVIHFLLTVFTGGLWIIIWIWRSCANSSHNRKMKFRVSIDDNYRIRQAEKIEREERHNRWAGLILFALIGSVIFMKMIEA